MSPPMLRPTWADFDSAVAVLAALLPRDATSLLAIPRGGLILGTALAHRTGLPLHLSAPAVREPGVVLVDDIADTGRTLAELRTVFGADTPALVWFRRSICREPALAACFVRGPEWILFPWERPEAAARDAKDFHARRQ